MPRLPWLADAARSTGFPVTEVDGWQTRGSTTFNPRGLLWHHTAGPSTGDMPSLGILVNGRSGLPGPLSQYGLGRSGRIYVVAAGRANHAGTGGWNGLTGNTSVIGVEAEHTGRASDPWPAVQLDAYRRLSAQILNRLGTTVDLMCGHKEWAPTRKVDPISLNMTDERTRVAALMREGEDDMVSLKLMVIEAGAKGWLPTQADIDWWTTLTNDPTNPNWTTFGEFWSVWKQKEYLALAGHPHAAATGDLNDAQVREISLEVGRQAFVEKGKPVVIRGT